MKAVELHYVLRAVWADDDFESTDTTASCRRCKLGDNIRFNARVKENNMCFPKI